MSFPLREKRLEFQHLNVVVFNIPMRNHPPKHFELEEEVMATQGLAVKKSPG